MRCKSGDVCPIDAGTDENRVERKFCEKHQTQLDKVRAQLGDLNGPAADRVRSAFAVDIARAVWGGRASNFHESVGVGRTNAHYRAALSICKRNNWIVCTGSRYKPGENPPPGFTASAHAEPEPATPRVTQSDRVKLLAQHVAKSERPVSRRDAADALGMSPNSLNRIIRQAKAEGLVRALPGPAGLVPVEQAAA